MKEIIWKDVEIENYGKLKVSSDGQVFSYKANSLLSLREHQDGYYFVRIGLLNGKDKTIGVHRLVAMAFVPNPDNKTEVNHKDFNRKNNNVENLEWMTHQENVQYSYENGRHIGKYDGSKNPKAELTEEQVLKIRDLYDNKNFRISEIAEIYGRGWSTINNIVKRLTWTHI